MNTLARFTSRINFFLLAILALGAVLRLWGIDFGLPYTLAPDEPTHFTIALRIFKTGNLNPGWLNYPSLMFYLNALALVPYFLIQHARGIWQTPADIPNPEIVTMGVGQLAAPSEFLLSRGLTALFGVASIFLIYKIGCAFGKGKSVGLIAALMLAVSPASVYNSHLIRPDTMAVFFALVSFFFAQKILDDPRPRNYVWAGIGAGLATACKYNMPLIGVAILAAHFLKFGRAGWRRKEIYFAIGAGALTLFAASPYILLDLPRFVHDFGFEIYAQGAGHAGFEGNTIPWYLNFLITTEGLIAIAALIQAARIVRAREARGIILLSFALLYYVFINLFNVRNDRTILPVLPFLHILAAMFIVETYDFFKTNARFARRAFVAASGLIALIIIVPISNAFASDARLTQTDARDSARLWLGANLPPGARVAEEAYTPYLDTQQFVVQGLDSLIDRNADWFAQNGFEYVIASQGMYGRFYAEPERYAQFVERYNIFFAHYAEFKRFDENGSVIRVFRTNAQLPSQRVAARFGNYGEIIELVGYDASVAPRDNVLHLKLFWRALQESAEPLELEIRVLDEGDEEVEKNRGDLFQGKGWQRGMFSNDETIPLSSLRARAPYRVQINVIQSRFSYALPAWNWTQENISPVLLSAIN